MAEFICPNALQKFAQKQGHSIAEWQSKVYKSGEKIDSEWRNAEIAARKRDKQTCRRCGSRKKLSVHHILPRDMGGENNLENLITLCYSCHNYIEAHAERLNSWELIINSYGEEIPIKVEQFAPLERDKNRPDWHAWVYGGQRNPNR